MKHTVVLFGLASVMLAGCVSGTTQASTAKALTDTAIGLKVACDEAAALAGLGVLRGENAGNAAKACAAGQTAVDAAYDAYSHGRFGDVAVDTAAVAKVVAEVSRITHAGQTGYKP